MRSEGILLETGEVRTERHCIGETEERWVEKGRKESLSKHEGGKKRGPLSPKNTDFYNGD